MVLFSTLMLLHLDFVLCLNEVQYLRILCSRDQPGLSALVTRRQKHTQLGPLAKAYLAFPLDGNKGSLRNTILCCMLIRQ